MTFDAAVVGAGHAGLAASFYLRQAGLSHTVLERGRVGESWRSQRWDSFVLNTPNWCSHLPGDEFNGADADAFYPRDEFVAILERYSDRFDLPVETGVEVLSVAQTRTGFELQIRSRSGERESLAARNVIVASGMQNVPTIPRASTRVPESILQLHSANYRKADLLPGGAVLVVGSGQSGFQIAEDLLAAGRRVFLSTSKVARTPRRYRGCDVLEWFRVTGILDLKTTEVEDRSIIEATLPHISGVGPRGHTVSHQQIAREGAVIVGRVTGFSDGAFDLADDAAENVRFSDEKSAEFKHAIDEFLRNSGRPLPPLEDDPNDAPDPSAACASDIRRLDPSVHDIRTVIWCTGFTGSFRWIKLPVLSERGLPVHVDGVSDIPGLFFLGFPWLRSRKSGIISGMEDDAAFIVSRVAKRGVAKSGTGTS